MSSLFYLLKTLILKKEKKRKFYKIKRKPVIYVKKFSKFRFVMSLKNTRK